MKNYKILKTTLAIKLIKRDHETEFATIDKLYLFVLLCVTCTLHKLLDLIIIAVCIT